MKRSIPSSACAAAIYSVVSVSADAAIINYSGGQSYGLMQVSAGHASSGPYDEQYMYSTDPTNYMDAFNVSANDSFVQYDPYCDCHVTYYASAAASSTLSINNDYAAGIFSASGAYDSIATGWFGAGGGVGSGVGFTITTPYFYSLDITVSAGTLAYANFQGQTQDFWGDYVYYYNTTDGVSVHQTGLLMPSMYPNYTVLNVNIGGCVSACIGSSGGSFQYSLVLTPTTVPVPAAAWLFGSGLVGMVGIARKRRA